MNEHDGEIAGKAVFDRLLGDDEIRKLYVDESKSRGKKSWPGRMLVWFCDRLTALIEYGCRR